MVRAQRWAAAGLRAQFATSFRVLGETADGRIEVEVGAPSAERIAEGLAGWGALLDVVGPDAVREHLARIGSELVERYGRTA